MPRRPRVATGGYVYHALNRAVGHSTIFEKVGDYAAFKQVLEKARHRVDMRLLAFCAIPTTGIWCCGRAKMGTCQSTWAGRPVALEQRGQNWLEYVNQAETEAELKALRRSARCGTPFGETIWQQATAKRLGLESTFRAPGRPRRRSDKP